MSQLYKSRVFSLFVILSMLLGALGVPTQSAQAAGTVSLTAGTTYSENFNTLANSGTSSTLPNGWYLSESGTGGNSTFTAGTGSGTTGDTYSFGAAGNTERAFGGLRSTSVVPTIGANFVNNTGATITTLVISYTGEEWRLGATGRTDRLDFQYSTSATSLTTGTWTDVNSLDFATPVTTTTGAKDGNASANRTMISYTITGLSIANGATFWVRWSDVDASGSDDGLAVDDFSLAPNGVLATFQEGVSSYAGTVDTHLKQASPTTPLGSDVTVEWDTEATNGNPSTQVFGLLRFDGVFGSGAGQIPVGSTISSATLQYVVSNSTADAASNLNEVLVDWTEASTYNSFGTTAGVQAEDYGTLVTTVPASATATFTIDVTSSLSAWSGNPSANRGWIIRPTASDGVAIASSENTTVANRPKLTVLYYPVTGPNITTTGTLNAFSSQPGVASAEQSYSVSGINLTANLVITAPADFEISTTSGSGFSSTINLTPTSGTVSATTIYVRFNRATAGTTTDNIAHTSTGATTRNVAVTGTATEAGTVTFAAFGDYGGNTSNEQLVANLVNSWSPDFIITTGDNSYGSAAPVSPAVSTIDQNVGKYYHDYIGNYIGGFTPGSVTNRFFPAMGNHDYTDGGGSTAYFNYFTLPNNERYYDFVQGPVHFFVIDSNPEGPGDGRSATSAQGIWLQAGLAASTSPWKIVYFHHPPFSSSSNHGSDTAMRWPFEAWGATAVLNGHDHTYERVMRDDNSNGVNMPYFVTGAGGYTLYNFGTPVSGSAVRYNANYGSMRVQASNSNITFEFWSVAGGGTLIDTYSINNSAPTIGITGTPLAGFTCQTGTPSAQQSYTVSGTNLTGDITITAPTDFELSLTSGSGFSSSPISLTPTSGTVASTPIYVRFNRATDGTSNGNITHTSTGATTQNVAVTGTASSSSCTPFTENFNSLTLGTRIGQVSGWTESGSASPAVVAGGLAGTQGLGTGSSIFNWSAHPFLWSDAGLTQGKFQMDFQTNASGAFDDDRLGWMTQNTPADSEYVFGIQLDPDTDGTACASGNNIETYWRNPAFSTTTRIETTIACLPTLTANAWYRAELVATKITSTSAKLDVSLTALDGSGNPGVVVASGTVADTSTWAGGAAPAAYFAPSGTSTALYPSYKNHSGTTGNADNAVADFCSTPVTQYTLGTSVVGNGSITLNPSGGTYNAGTVVQVTAVPGSGAAFSGWSGDLTGSTNPTTITMTSNKSITATFVSATTVTFQEGVNGYAGTLDTFVRGTTEGNTNFGSSTVLEWDENTGTTTDEITMIRFTNVFSSSSGPIPDGATIVSASLTYKTTDLNSGSTANGDPANVYESLVDWPEATVTYNNFGGDAGVQADEYVNLVASAPATALSTAYTIDVTASLQRWIANPSTNLGWIFVPTLSDGVTVYSSEDATVSNRPILTVVYMVPLVTLTVNKLGNGTGTVTSAPAGIDCGADCTEDYASNTLVSLTATADPGSTFTYWSDLDCMDANPCVVTMDAAKTISAMFRVPATLVLPSGTTNGWGNTFEWDGVTGASRYYLEMLKADDTLVHRKWYDAATYCSGLDCAVTVSGLGSLPNGGYKWRILDYGPYGPAPFGYGMWSDFKTFTLDAACYTLNTSVNLPGSGTVTASAQNCTGGYTAGTVVQVTAVPNPGYVFTNWGGDASGTSNPVLVTMTGSKSVTANLREASATLNSPVNTMSNWNGSFDWDGVTGATRYYLELLKADDTLVHRRWYDAGAYCSGLDCLVTSAIGSLPNGDYKWRVLDYGAYGYGSWTAFTDFELGAPCYTLTTAVNLPGSGTVTASAQNCTGGYTAGTVVQVTAVPNPGYVFTNWGGDVTGSSSPVSVTMTGPRSVTANLREASATLLSPDDLMPGWNGSFQWSGVTGGSRYYLELLTADNTLVHRRWYYADVSCVDLICAVTPVIGTLPAGDYKWRLLDYGSYGYGSWTAFTEFTLP